jgi:hypothetical protein
MSMGILSELLSARAHKRPVIFGAQTCLEEDEAKGAEQGEDESRSAIDESAIVKHLVPGGDFGVYFSPTDV